MAQAARLCLRMQKELKLLLSDPPPGASFPRLSSAAGTGDLSSLSSIDAHVEGPEGTVYANGVFNVKIQIPDRYPFQPPIVTFATPIYHPNIDNGGRICLDILNLPPKGAWQPSLNISTVLTSIGLLLSEPNPDDGLMCEASREYKYNRQAFDHKARAMTEKYAKAGSIGTGSSISFHVQNSSDPSMVQIHGDEKTSESKKNGLAASDTKPSGIMQKLSMESALSITRTKNCDIEAKDLLDHRPFHSGSEDPKDENGKRKAETFKENRPRKEELHMSRRKLSLASSGQVQKKDGYHEEPSVDNINSGSRPSEDIQKEPVFCPGTSTSSFSMHQRQSHTYGNSATGVDHNEPCSVGKNLSLGLKRPSVKQEQESSDKENAAPVNNLLTSNSQTVSAKSSTSLSRKLSLRPPGQLQVNNLYNSALFAQQVSVYHKELETNQNQDDAILLGGFEISDLEKASMSETIVLDSDDGAEEGICSSRSRLSLARRGIRKQKNRA